MQRRGGSGQPVKGKRTPRPKARNAPTAHLLTDHSPEQFDRLKHERDEALEQQAATSEILRVISRSPSDVQPVFDMIAESAARLCEAQFCFVYRFDGQLLHFVAHRSLTAEVLEINRRAYPAPPSRGSVAARAILERNVVQIPDVSADPDYALGAMAAVGGYRSAVAVPILRDGLPIGSIAVTRAQAGLLPNRQIELLKTFADQAAIAIENVRLFNETKEALEQQTATSEVLKVISSSPGELEPVFNAMLANATRICDAAFGNLFLREGPNMFRAVATHNKRSYDEYLRPNSAVDLRDNPGVPLDRVAKTKQVVHIPDLRTDQSYLGKNHFFVPLVEAVGARTFVSVPMLKEGQLIGAINMYRQEVRPFTDKQIELVKNFAAQAVIAIENTRLLNELRQRTDDLTETLDQQTATSQVLKVISSSPGELKPVFESMLENAVRICEASFGNLLLYENDAFRHVALHNAPQAWAAEQQRDPVAPRRSARFLYHVADTKRVNHIADIALENPEEPIAKIAGARTLLIVPMLKEDNLVGVIAIYRQEVLPFTDKQVELVQNFAAQAVIAIENTRLLTELRKSLQQQTATADVLKVISRSAFDLQAVLDTLTESAAHLCEADLAVIARQKGEAYHLTTAYGYPPGAEEYLQTVPHMGRGSIVGRTVL